MNDVTKTLVYAGVAGLLVGAAILARPRIRTPELFKDQGQPFYPDFKDARSTTSLEVIDKDETTQKSRAFKVMLKDGKWVIPSMDNHPADAKERLEKTAAAMMDLKKDALRSDNSKDHELYGVNDPLEEGLKGYGIRVTLKDIFDAVQADFIFGKPVKEKSGWRYVRVPDQKRVFECKVPYEPSAKFMDWVETDLLKIEGSAVKRITFDPYVLDDATQDRADEDLNVLVKGEGATWKLTGLQENEEVNTQAVNDAASALRELKIVDVRRKHPALVERLASWEKWTSNEVNRYRSLLMDWVTRGFTLKLTKGGDFEIISKQGEIQIGCEDGVTYRIWFADVVPEADRGRVETKDNRYILIRTGFDESLLPPSPEPPKETTADGKPKSDDDKKRDQAEFERKKKERDDKIAAGRKREAELARRFADWYYVISDESFKKLRKKRPDLVKAKTEKKEEKKEPAKSRKPAPKPKEAPPKKEDK